MLFRRKSKRNETVSKHITDEQNAIKNYGRYLNFNKQKYAYSQSKNRTDTNDSQRLFKKSTNSAKCKDLTKRLTKCFESLKKTKYHHYLL